MLENGLSKQRALCRRIESSFGIFSCLAWSAVFREAVRVDLRWIWSTAHTRIQRVDLRHLRLAQREVENVDVFGDPCRLNRLGDGNDTILELPAQNDLRGRFPMRPADTGDDRIRQRIPAAGGGSPGPVALHSTDRRPRLGHDPERRVFLSKLLLDEVGMELDLVDRGNDFGACDQRIELLFRVIANTDRSYPSRGEQLLGSLVGLNGCIEVSCLSVQQVEVEIIEPKSGHALVEAAQRRVKAVVRQP